MSTVVVDIDNQYEDDLCDGYQLICEDDDTYTIWVSTDRKASCRERVSSPV